MPTLPRLFIDWLHLSIPVEHDDREAVQRRLDDFERWTDIVEGEELRRGSRYRFQYTIRTPNGARIALHSMPWKAGTKYLKLEYSPRNVDESGGHVLARYLRYVLGADYRTLYYNGTVIRADITLDAHRIPVRDLWVQDLRNPTRTSAIIRGSDLRAETLYFGYGNATRQLIVYDKGAEQGRPRNTTPCTRIEYRYTKDRYSLHELHAELRNPLNGFRIKRYAPLGAPITPDVSRAIFDALRLRGAGDTGSDQGSSHDLIQYADRFDDWYTWTRRTTIWAGLGSYIRDLLPDDD